MRYETTATLHCELKHTTRNSCVLEGLSLVVDVAIHFDKYKFTRMSTSTMLRLFLSRASKTRQNHLKLLQQQQQRSRLLSYYVPTLTERRPQEAGTGGRNSEAGLKVALFGASGFLGQFVCGELGKDFHFIQ